MKGWINMKNFFFKNIKNLLKEFDVIIDGLMNKKVCELLELVGENVLNEKKKKSIFFVFID